MRRTRGRWQPAAGLAVAMLTLGSAVAGPVPDSAGDVRPLLIGAEVPDAGLRTPDGKETKLRTAIGDDPAIIVFYRGGW